MPRNGRPPGDAKVAVICLSGGKGGMELDAVKAAKMLNRAVGVVLLVKHGGFLDRNRASLLAGCDIPVETIRFRVNYSLPMATRAYRALHVHGVSHAICFGNSELKSLSPVLAVLGVTVIVRHGTTKSRPKRDFFHRLIYRAVRHHVAISRHLAKNVAAIYPIAPDSPVRLIYPSIPAPIVEKCDRPGATIRIVHVGRICRGKGQDAAVRACGRLAHAGIDFELALVGEAAGAEGDAVRQLIAEHGLADRVRLSGHVENVYPYLLSADVFLYPSFGEGFGNVLAEALCVGLVAVVYDNTALSEIMRLGFYGHLVQDRDERALADVLLRVCSDIVEEKRRAFANAARARELFSEERERREYLQLLDRAAEA